MTKAEVLPWIRLRNKQFLNHRVLRQYSIGKYVVDFYIPVLKLAIEVDGATHSSSKEIEYDMQRTAQLEAVGVSVLRVTNAEVYAAMAEVLESIKKKVIEMSSRS